MKLLENTEFEALSSKLSTETGVSQIESRFDLIFLFNSFIN